LTCVCDKRVQANSNLVAQSVLKIESWIMVNWTLRRIGQSKNLYQKTKISAFFARPRACICELR
jgi:hypothetical protein